MAILSACGGAPPPQPPPRAPAPPVAVVAESGAPIPAGMADSRWRLQEVDGVSVPVNEGAWIELGTEGINGTSGCNRFGLLWYAPVNAETRDQTNEVGQVLQTHIGCIEPKQTLENRMFRALAEAPRIRRLGDRLEVPDRQDRVVLRFVACDACGKTAPEPAS